MDIHIRNIPAQCSNAELKGFLTPLLKNVRITEYECAKVKNKSWGMLYIHDLMLAESFIRTYHYNSPRWRGRRHPVQFERSQIQTNGEKVKSLKADNDLKELIGHLQQQQLDPAPLRNNEKRTFNVTSVQCGHFDYKHTRSIFTSRAALGTGRLVLGTTTAAIILGSPEATPEWKYRIDIPYHLVDLAVASPAGPNSPPAITMSLQYAPKIFKAPELPVYNPFVETILHPAQQRRLEIQRKTKHRVSHVTQEHRDIVGLCFVYRMTLQTGEGLIEIEKLLRNGPEMPSVVTLDLPVQRHMVQEARSLKIGMETLQSKLHDYEQQSRLPFAVCFQVLKLATNGKLLPWLLVNLLPEISSIVASFGAERTVLGLRELYRTIPTSGPHTSWKDIESSHLASLLTKLCREATRFGTAYDIVRKNQHLVMIYRAQITPTGFYLEGPEAEVSNRVLRKYADHTDSFVRVAFGEEDGGRLDFSLNTKLDAIYSEFKLILDNGFPICKRKFQFLGFSSSSLKSQTCWFMTPFFVNDVQSGLLTGLTASMVIEGIGNSKIFRSPAKCAARIGQAFTDTTGYLKIGASATARIKDIERNGRCFSDGCGTISYGLVEQICNKYPKFLMKIHPVIFQIRFQGSKGMVSLDTGLNDEMICIRPSMAKFDTKGTFDIEVCGIADRPLTLYLNRPLVKVLEDLGIPSDVFLEMQSRMVAEMEGITSNTINAANFLESEHIATSTGVPDLLRHLYDIGLDPQEDVFLRSVVEMGALHKLRDVKYRARIKVEHGKKLYGIMDETGFLKEGEIFVVFETPEHGRSVVVGDRVLVTRSPTMHPGDIQVAKAVQAPKNSMLNNLFNCVVFSQYGTRDLPSQLGGGDLDGDQFDIIWDPQLIPKYTVVAADYPRATSIDIGREVLPTDITSHFVDFMENDRVGQISSLHLQLSDRLSDGTRNSSCIKLAHMASVAVDYGKTGIPVNMDERPRFDTSLKPDFMAPSPRVWIEEEGLGALIEEPTAPDPHDAFAALDPDNRKITYYKSEKALGKLFRHIDERRFYNQLRNLSNGKQGASAAAANTTTLRLALQYVLFAAKGIQWRDYLPEARSIRDTYEAAVENIQHEFALRQTQPLHELEVLTGTILGAGGKRIRELAMEMGQRFERDISYVRDMVRCPSGDGDGGMGDDDDDGDDEALPRSIACFHLALMEPPTRKRVISWKYVAAAMCLREVASLQMNGGMLKTFGGAWTD